MNAEYLLDAIGRLDDDLIQEAERYRRPKTRYGRLLGLAACFAMVIALGYVLTHVGGMSGGGAAPGFSGGGNSAAPAGGSSAPSMEDNAGVPAEPDAPLEGAAPSSPSGDSAEEPNSSAPVWDEPFTISMRLDVGHDYVSFFLYPKILDELPEGCVELGKLELWDVNKETEELYVPYTYSEEYAGCPVWLLAEENPEAIHFYVGLPEGGYLVND